MMRSFYAALMAVAFATPVLAQDIATDFANAYERIYGGGGAEPLVASLNGLNVLAAIEGRWIDAALVMNGPDFDAELAPRACNFIHTAITRDGAFGFVTETMRGDEPQGDLRTYMFSNGNYFAFTTDLDGVSSRLWGDQDPTTLEPQLLATTVLGAQNSGVVRVEFVGPDVVMMDSPTAPPMVLTRCP